MYIFVNFSPQIHKPSIKKYAIFQFCVYMISSFPVIVVCKFHIEFNSNQEKLLFRPEDLISGEDRKYRPKIVMSFLDTLCHMALIQPKSNYNFSSNCNSYPIK